MASLSDSYIYGRLFIDVPNAALAIDGHTSMGLVIKCADGNLYTLRFYNSKPVFAIKAKPSLCSLTETVYTDVDGMVRGRKPYVGNDLQNIELKAGVAYYVGDYLATFNATANYQTYTHTWVISDKRNDYLKTTQEMKLDFPNISMLPTIDLSH